MGYARSLKVAVLGLVSHIASWACLQFGAMNSTAHATSYWGADALCLTGVNDGLPLGDHCVWCAVALALFALGLACLIRAVVWAIASPKGGGALHPLFSD